MREILYTYLKICISVSSRCPFGLFRWGANPLRVEGDLVLNGHGLPAFSVAVPIRDSAEPAMASVTEDCAAGPLWLDISARRSRPLVAANSIGPRNSSRAWTVKVSR